MQINMPKDILCCKTSHHLIILDDRVMEVEDSKGTTRLADPILFRAFAKIQSSQQKDFSKRLLHVNIKT